MTPLGKTEKDWNANKIKAIIESTHECVTPHHQWKKDDGCQALHDKTLASLSVEHFTNQRVAERKTRVDEQGSNCKKANAIQQIKPQQHAAMISGLIPHGKLFLKKNNHFHGLEVELIHRGVPKKDVPKKITARKEKLRTLEAQQLMKDKGLGMKDAVEQSKKHFQVLSTIEFIID